MPDLRFDPIHQIWVAIAENRSLRPNEFAVVDQSKPLGTCPFCSGHEQETPPERSRFHYKDIPDKYRHLVLDESKNFLLSDATNSNWVSRIVPNRYPAFGPSDLPHEIQNSSAKETNHQAESKFSSDASDSHGPYRTKSGNASRQYLIIESPRHITGFAQLNDAETIAGFLTYQQVFQKLREHSQFQHVMLFKNCRPAAGASLAHIHTQVVALDFVPSWIRQKTHRLSDRQAEGKDWFNEILEFEVSEKTRLVHQTENWAVICPFASRFPYQTWILPKGESLPLWKVSQDHLLELGFLVRKAVRAFDRATAEAAYNILFHQPPLREEALGRESSGKQAPFQGHSFTELFARSNGPAGFEWGTNCWINPVSPESAASRLRECWED